MLPFLHRPLTQMNSISTILVCFSERHLFQGRQVVQEVTEVNVCALSSQYHFNEKPFTNRVITTERQHGKITPFYHPPLEPWSMMNYKTEIRWLNLHATSQTPISQTYRKSIDHRLRLLLLFIVQYIIVINHHPIVWYPTHSTDGSSTLERFSHF